MTESTYCRLCAELKQDSDVIFLYKEDSLSSNFNLKTKIFQCFQIQIDPQDNLPSTVCSNCCQIINDTYNAYQKFHQSQEFLKNVYHLLMGAPHKDPEQDLKPEWKEVKASSEPNHLQIKQENHESDIDNVEPDFSAFPDPSYDDDDWSDSNDIPLSKCFEFKEEKIKTEISEDTPRKRKKKVEVDSDAEIKTESQKRRDEEWKDYVWTCSECAKDFPTLKCLRKHYKNDHSNKPPEYTCMDCAKVYTKYPLFRRHVQKHRDRYKYRCEICNKFFHLKFRYQTHMKHVHETSDQQYVCPLCGKCFKWPSSLDNHKRYVHVTDDRKYQFECDICHKKVVTASNLAMHKKVHEVEKNFICEQCGRNFKEKGTLVQHMSTHLEVCSFACEECPKAFKDLYGLRRHKKIHMDSELYHCEVCARPFKHKRALKRHASIHTNMLPYECEYCKKCFREKSYLKIHLRQHTGEKPYSCIECNQHFTNDSNFIKHIRGRHGLERFSIANQNQYPFVIK